MTCINHLNELVVQFLDQKMALVNLILVAGSYVSGGLFPFSFFLGTPLYHELALMYHPHNRRAMLSALCWRVT